MIADHKRKILIVDDEERLLRILSIKFKVSGYETLVATEGKKALEMIIQEKPDIVLLDIIMPGIDGFQVLENLRMFSEIPVIAFSARPENGARAITAGATEFIGKPFDMDRLMERIERVLQDN